MDNDPCKFVLSCRGSSERFTLQAANVDIKQVWVRHIQVLLDDQNKFLYGEKTQSQLSRLCQDTLGVLMFALRVTVALQSPIEYQKDKIGAGSSASLTRNRSSSGNRPTMSNRPSSAVGLGDKGPERGRSQMRVSTSNGGPSCFESRVSHERQLLLLFLPLFWNYGVQCKFRLRQEVGDGGQETVLLLPGDLIQMSVMTAGVKKMSSQKMPENCQNSDCCFCVSPPPRSRPPSAPPQVLVQTVIQPT